MLELLGKKIMTMLRSKLLLVGPMVIVYIFIRWDYVLHVGTRGADARS